jgi:hypothetical protein
VSNDNTVLLEGARLVFRNFAGAEGQYNRAGDRNFAVVLDERTADKLEKEGYNVKRKPPREEGDEEFIYLSVKVSYKVRPPRVVMITKSQNRRTVLDESTVELLDYAELENVDLIIRPYVWTVNGKTGTTAYLKTIYATLREDELDLKYAGYRDDGRALPPADDFLEGEIVGEYEEEYNGRKMVGR